MPLPDNYFHLKIKPHYCLTCEDEDPNNFYSTKKDKCKICYDRSARLYRAKNKAKNNEAHQRQLVRNRKPKTSEQKEKYNLTKREKRKENKKEYRAYERERYLRRKANGTLSSTQKSKKLNEEN